MTSRLWISKRYWAWDGVKLVAFIAVGPLALWAALKFAPTFCDLIGGCG